AVVEEAVREYSAQDNGLRHGGNGRGAARPAIRSGADFPALRARASDDSADVRRRAADLETVGYAGAGMARRIGAGRGIGNGAIRPESEAKQYARDHRRIFSRNRRRGEGFHGGRGYRGDEAAGGGGLRIFDPARACVEVASPVLSFVACPGKKTGSEAG